MSLVVSAVVVTAFAFAFRRPIAAHPAAFYVLAAAIAALGVHFTWNPVASDAVRAFAFAVQKGHVGFSMLALVMFVGVFAECSRARRALAPIRGELSIAGGVLIAGHFILYLASYAGMLGSFGALKPAVAASCLIAVVLLALLAVLFVTSFPQVKRLMGAKPWKRVQMLAYPFFALAFAHLLGFFAVPLANGSPRAQVMCALYAAVFLAYAALRVRRRAIDGSAIVGGKGNSACEEA